MAKVTRKVSSKKRITTDKRDGFESESDATEWAQSVLAKLISKQRQSNTAQLQKRKENQQIKLQRSARRASKTEQAKSEATESLYGKTDASE